MVFLKNHSTAYALIQLYDKLSDAIDQGKVTLGLFIDLSKAFDTVNHDILLAKRGGHWGILETAKPKKKNHPIPQNRKKIRPKPKTVKNRYNGDKWGIQSNLN